MSQIPNTFGQYANRNAPTVALPKEPGLPKRAALPKPPRLITIGKGQTLPSLVDLDLLDRGRGVYIEPDPEPEPERPEIDVSKVNLFLKHQGRKYKLREYRLSSVSFEDDRKIEILQPYVMIEVTNETQAVFHRMTKSGRHLTYVLKVVQPPERARACGSGDKAGNDRRPVDPPPVVSLQISQNGVDITNSYESSFMCFVGLEHARAYAHGSLQNPPNPAVLRGSSVAGAAYLNRPFNAAYFIYSDLSVQHEGYFRLKFNLFEQIRNNGDLDMNSSESISAEGLSPCDSRPMQMMGAVTSKPFTVFSAKKFPGLAQSTELSKAIADQGCRVRIRRDIRQRKEYPTKAKPSKESAKDAPQPSASQHRDSFTHPPTPQHTVMAPGNGWNRPEIPAPRLSVATTAVSDPQSRAHSYSHAPMSSPAIAQSPQYSPYNRDQYTPQMLQSPMHEKELYGFQKRSSVVSMSGQQLPPISSLSDNRNHAGPSHGYRPPPPQADPSLKLPPLLSMLAEQPAYVPPRPEGLYNTTPLTAKRNFALSRDERNAALKGGARPTLTPTSRLGPFMGPPAPGVYCPPLASGDSIIEADIEDDAEDGSDVRSLFSVK